MVNPVQNNAGEHFRAQTGGKTNLQFETSDMAVAVWEGLREIKNSMIRQRTHLK